MNLTAYIFFIIATVESNSNPNAVGDNGAALGMYQLHAAYVQDASEHSGIYYEHKDAYDQQRAEDIINSYMDRYATTKRLGHPPTIQDICRIHNGGPNGYKRSSTEAYWQKCKAVMDTIQLKEQALKSVADYNNNYIR
jgi:hypothetical protein|tara:strand:+ start:38 stop:451 length:414 start_codon:yes stop_codon:yes gene_type:complete